MIVYRAFPRNARAKPAQQGGPLWFPRDLQGEGRHDNPELYGCLYLSEAPVAAVAEALATFRGTGELRPSMLIRDGFPLTLATISLRDGAQIVDLDEPRVLVRERLRPSRIATGQRDTTQADAGALFARHPRAAALRWWSTLEAGWAHLTVFDRARWQLKVEDTEPLELGQPAVVEAAEWIGLI